MLVFFFLAYFLDRTLAVVDGFDKSVADVSCDECELNLLQRRAAKSAQAMDQSQLLQASIKPTSKKTQNEDDPETVSEEYSEEEPPQVEKSEPKPAPQLLEVQGKPKVMKKTTKRKNEDDPEKVAEEYTEQEPGQPDVKPKSHLIETFEQHTVQQRHDEDPEQVAEEYPEVEPPQAETPQDESHAESELVQFSRFTAAHLSHDAEQSDEDSQRSESSQTETSSLEILNPYQEEISEESDPGSTSVGAEALTQLNDDLNCDWLILNWTYSPTLEESKASCAKACTHQGGHDGSVTTRGYSSFLCQCRGGRIPKEQLCGHPQGTQCCPR